VSDVLAQRLEGVSVVRTEGVSVDGVVIGKYLSRSKFERSLPLGPAISDLAFSFDIGGAPQFGWWGDWRQEFLGDIHQRPDVDTIVPIANRPRHASCIVDFVGVDGTPLPVCPRSTLKRVVERLGSHGLTARVSFEIEAIVFTDSLAEARAKRFRGLTPLGLPKAIAYLNQDSYELHAYLDEVVRRLDAMGIVWDAWSAEGAPGQFELNFPPSDPVTAADQTMRARVVLKETAFDLGLSMTFMSKPTETYGSGTHIHHSLQRDGVPAFFDETSPGNRSALMRHWVGGLMATMPAAHSFLTPTINSFRRMVNFAAAPVIVSWGEENKSTALRLISRSPGLARVEHRAGAADVNPYLGLAAILAGGIVGIEQAIEPPDELRVMAWGLPDSYPYLPGSITAAAEALENDKALTDVVGTEMCEHWAKSRRWEWLMFHTTGGDAEATSVTDWELDRYFELV
jgi:glutamine synthetase